MHARASHITGDPAQLDQGAALMETELYPQLEQVDGFRGVVTLGQRSTGKSLVITFWDSEEAMEASEERANQMRSQAASQMGAPGAPEVERFEVLFYRARES